MKEKHSYANRKKLRIKVKAHMRAKLAYAVVVYILSMCCSLILANKFAKIADGAWWDQIRVSICIVSLIYFIICCIVNLQRKKMWIITIDSREVFYNGEKVRCYKIHRTIFQRIFGLCDLTLYGDNYNRLCKLKDISVQILDYL